MDFQQFGIDERLSRAVEGMGVAANLFEAMLERAVQKHENVCAKVTLSEGGEAVCLLPALQWLATAPEGEGRRVLVVTPDLAQARVAAASAAELGSCLGAGLCLVLDPESQDAVPSIEGEASAAIAIGAPPSLLAASQGGLISLRDYGFLVVLGADRLADLPPEVMRKLGGALLPSWERRCVLSCAKLSVKAKNLAWDLADNPSEIHVEETASKARGVARETWRVGSGDKFRLLLGLVARAAPARLCVFCNLRSTAEEVANRLEANGVGSDYLLGALPLPRKLAILEKTKGGDCPVLVLTDQGAEGLPSASFPLVVNFDIPLEPEYFVKRLELLDRGAEGAKVLSLACERYESGIAAVEHYIDASLEAVQCEDSMLAAEDKSEGQSLERRPERPRERDGEHPGRARDGDRQRRRDASRGDAPRGDAPRGEGPRNDRGRDNRRRDEARGEGRRGQPQRGDRPSEDRSPDIRRSISEATGGSIDMEAVGARPNRGSQGERRPEAEHRSKGERHPEGERRSEGERRPPRREDGKRGSPSRPSGGQQRGNSRGGGQSRPPRSAPRPASGNPYELPMEERMRLYREKYGSRLESAPAGKRSRDEGERSRKSAAAPTNAPPSREGPPSRENASGASGVPETKERGSFLGKLFGGSRKKEE